MDEAFSVDPLDADELVQRGALMVDVRESFEFEAGHAPGARLIPLGELMQRITELDGVTEVVCVCRSGARSAEATELLRRRGAMARNLSGGMLAWAAEGLPVTTPRGGSGTVV